MLFSSLRSFTALFILLAIPLVAFGTTFSPLPCPSYSTARRTAATTTHAPDAAHHRNDAIFGRTIVDDDSHRSSSPIAVNAERQNIQDGFSLLEESDSDNITYPRTTGAPGVFHYAQVDPSVIAFFNKSDGRMVQPPFTKANITQIFPLNSSCTQWDEYGMRSPRMFYVRNDDDDHRWLVVYSTQSTLCWLVSPATAETIPPISSWTSGELMVTQSTIINQSAIAMDRITAGVFPSADALVFSFQYQNPTNIPPLNTDVGVVAVRLSNFSQHTDVYVDQCTNESAYGNQFSPTHMAGQATSTYTNIPLLRIDYFNGIIEGSIQWLEYWEMQVNWSSNFPNETAVAIEMVQRIGLNLREKWPQNDRIPVQNDGDIDIHNSVPLLGNKPVYRTGARSNNGDPVESIVGAYHVIAPNGGGPFSPYCTIQVFELRRAAQPSTSTSWELFQTMWIRNDGKYNEQHHRFVPSISSDSNLNLAWGYTTAGVQIPPDMRYAFHESDELRGDIEAEYTIEPVGTKPSDEDQWMTFNSMDIDPVDDETFHYLSAYYQDSEWKSYLTQIQRNEPFPPSDGDGGSSGGGDGGDGGDNRTNTIEITFGIIGALVLLLVIALIGSLCVALLLSIIVAIVFIRRRNGNIIGKHYKMEDLPEEKWESSESSKDDGEETV